MTAIGGRLAAEQSGSRFKLRRGEYFADPTFLHQPTEIALVCGPLTFAFFVRIEQLLRRCEERRVLVDRADELCKKVRQVLRLRETRKLRRVVQTYVEKSLYVSRD